jgi:hypothetical protein
MYRTGGTKEADDPKRRPCDCDLCSGQITPEIAVDNKVARTSDEHSIGCECDDCEDQREIEREQLDWQQERKDADCKLYGISDDVWEMMSTYHRHLSDADWGAVKDEPCRLQSIKAVGDTVTSRIESDAMPSADD